MKKIILTLGMICSVSASASDLGCDSLVGQAVTALGKINSGSAMILNEVKQISVKSSADQTKTFIYKAWMKDSNTDSYDGYQVTAQTFSGGKGCLIKKIEMFQYD